MKGHIRKRGKTSWEIAINLGRDAQGKRRQKFHNVRGTKRDAQRKLNEILHQLDTGSYVAPQKVTVGVFLDKWLSHVEATITRKTFIRYREICRRHLATAFGQLPLTKLQPLHIQDMYAGALKSGRLDGKGGLSARTIIQHHRVLREALQAAVQWQLLVRNPADAVSPPRASKHEMRALTEQETVKLLRAAEGSRLYMPVLLAATSGLRRGELLALRWQDIDGETLRVQQAVEQVRGEINIKTPKTAKGKRAIALPSIAVEALRQHRAQQAEERLMLGPDYQDNGFVFCQPDGRLWRPDTFTANYRTLVECTDLGNVRFHDLRHTHATHLLRQGVHPKVVSERLGHATIAITLDTYSHVLPDMQAEAAGKIDTALRAALD
jgi:integrase